MCVLPVSSICSRSVSLEGLKVLLVEDDEAIGKLIGLVLRRAGAIVAAAENGKIAVGQATDQAFDLVLMDMQMPVMDGYTAAGILRRGFTAPIVAFTAEATQAEANKCLMAGCSDFLTKPIDRDRLLTFVDHILNDKHIRAAAEAAVTPRAIDKNACGGAGNGHPPLMSTLPTEDPDFREIVEEFRTRLKEKLGCMRQAWAAGELSVLADLAHWLKGAGGTAGFPGFFPAALKLEKLARTGQSEAIEAVLCELVKLSDRIVVPASDSLPAPPAR